MHNHRRKAPAKRLWVGVLAIGFLIVSAGILASILTWGWIQQPISKTDETEINFSIESGTSTTQIGQMLTEAGLIRHPLVFRAVLYQEGIGSKIQAGDFVLRKNQSVSEIAKTLTRAIDTQIKVTLFEGCRREEVAQILETTFSDYGVEFSQSEFLDQPETKEGFIFPDTYYFTPRSNPVAVAKSIEATFNQKIAPLRDQIENSKYSLNQILTIASIVEREARIDRELVAGILIKRLENDWPLQADATLQYAKGVSLQANCRWIPPLAADKDIESPYNTYKYPGLPPAPIANPSLSSIQAVLNAQSDTQYWYYITDNQGGMHYAVTYDQHLDNINRYLR